MELNHRYGYVNKFGNEVIPLKYDGAGPFSEELACVALPDGPLAIINKEDGVIFKLDYDICGHHTAAYSDGLECSQRNDFRHEMGLCG